MNHLIQLEEKLDEFEFARQKLRVLVKGGDVLSAKGKSGNPLHPPPDPPTLASHK